MGDRRRGERDPGETRHSRRTVLGALTAAAAGRGDTRAGARKEGLADRDGDHDQTDDADANRPGAGGVPPAWGPGSPGRPPAGPTPSLRQVEVEGTLTLAQPRPPASLDPLVADDGQTVQVLGRIFEGLYGYGTGTALRPELAAGPPEVTRGGTRYVVELDGRARFQNGEPVTADDVVYSFRTPLAEDTARADDLSMLASATAVDARTVQFDLSAPYRPFRNVLASPVVSRTARAGDLDRFGRRSPVGSGPFRFEGWAQGPAAVLRRWDDYWGNPTPTLAGVRFVAVPDAGDRVDGLLAGRYDVVDRVPAGRWATVERSTTASVTAAPVMGYFYVAFNCNAGPTADPAVREAVDYALDLDDAVETVLGPRGQRQYGPLPRPLAEAWDMPVERWRRVPHETDVERARSTLVDVAVVPEDWTPRIIAPPDDARVALARRVADALEAAGYGAEVDRLAWRPFLDTYATGDPADYQIYVMGWNGLPDPDAFTYYFFTAGDDVRGVTDGTYYADPDGPVASALREARASTDRDRRRRLYADAIERVLRSRPHLPAYTLRRGYGVHDRVARFEARPVSRFDLAEGGAGASVGGG